MELLKQLELVEVKYENDNKKATMTFLDKDRGEIREVTFNKQSYDNGQFTDDSDKAKKVDEWCDTYFKLPFKDLKQAIGTKHDIYAYEKFNSLWESDIVAKFGQDMIGQILTVKISGVKVDKFGCHIQFPYEKDTYETKMMWAEYKPEFKQWFVNPQKKIKQQEKFAEKFQTSIDNAQSLVGKTLIVEIKSAFGHAIYADAKPFPKKK
jgi:hypothetical protein